LNFEQKNYSKFNIFHKCHWIYANPNTFIKSYEIGSFLTITKVCPNSIIIFLLKRIFMKYLFSIIFDYKLKHCEPNLIHLYSLKTCQRHQKHDKTHHGFGDFNVTNKSNKLLSFIDKYWRFSRTINGEKT